MVLEVLLVELALQAQLPSEAKVAAVLVMRTREVMELDKLLEEQEAAQAEGMGEMEEIAKVAGLTVLLLVAVAAVLGMMQAVVMLQATVRMVKFSFHGR